MDKDLLADKHKIVYNFRLLSNRIYFFQMKTERFTEIISICNYSLQALIRLLEAQ